MACQESARQRDDRVTAHAHQPRSASFASPNGTGLDHRRPRAPTVLSPAGRAGPLGTPGAGDGLSGRPRLLRRNRSSPGLASFLCTDWPTVGDVPAANLGDHGRALGGSRETASRTRSDRVAWMSDERRYDESIRRRANRAQERLTATLEQSRIATARDKRTNQRRAARDSSEGLGRERRGSRSTERAGELGEDRQIGVRPNPIQAPDTER
jgi:hypothetical protein